MVNAFAAYYLSAACKVCGAVFVHISTDYVFDGRTGNYTEEEKANPEGIYGRTKYMGERLALKANGQCLIMRTAWLYGRHGGNFVHDIIKKAKSGYIDVVDDQTGNPTSAAELVSMIGAAVNAKRYGIYHAVCGGQASRYDFAKKIVELAGIPCSIRAVKTENGKSANTSLSNRKLRGETGYEPAEWRQALTDYMRNEAIIANIL